MKENATRTVLILDDSQDDREYFAELFRRSTSDIKYEVLTAADAEEGMEVYRKHAIDCTLIDYNMPGVDGLAVVDALQKLTPAHNIPAVIFTGEHSPKLQAEAARKGAMDYVIKDSISSADQLEKVVGKVISWVTEPAG